NSSTPANTRRSAGCQSSVRPRPSSDPSRVRGVPRTEADRREPGTEALVVRDPVEAAPEDLRDGVRERRTPVKTPQPEVPHSGVRHQLSTHHGTNPVRADKEITLVGTPVRELHPDPAADNPVTGHRSSEVDV